MSVAWVFLEILLNGYDAAYYMSIVSVKSGLKSWVKKVHLILFFAGLVTAYSIINFTTDFYLISMYLFPSLMLIYIFYFVDGPIIQRIFWFIFPLALLYCIELLTMSLFMYGYNIPLEIVGTQNAYRLQCILIAKSIDSIVWYYLWKQKEDSLQTSLRSLALLSSVTFCFFISITFIFMSNIITTLYVENLLRFAPMLIILLTFSFTAIFGFIHKKSRDQQVQLSKEKAELTREIEKFEEQKNSLKTAYHAEIIKAYKTVRQFRHDILNHLQIIWPLAQSHKSTGLQQFVEAFEQINQQLQIHYQTGDDLLDVIVAIKEAEAFNQGIALHIKGQIPAIHSFQAEDLCLILDHLLNNALKEVGDITDPEAAKVVTLTLSNAKNDLVITLENPTNGGKRVKELNSIESPPEVEFELQTIQETVEKYRGALSIAMEHVDYYRTIFIQLPHPGFSLTK